MTPFTAHEAGRDFYNTWRGKAADEAPDIAARLPAWDDLNPEQAHAWILAMASTAETAVRMADAVMAVIPADRQEAS
jgi:hypothetical protein